MHNFEWMKENFSIRLKYFRNILGILVGGAGGVTVIVFDNRNQNILELNFWSFRFGLQLSIESCEIIKLNFKLSSNCPRRHRIDDRIEYFPSSYETIMKEYGKIFQYCLNV